MNKYLSLILFLGILTKSATSASLDLPLKGIETLPI